jgi:dTDP-4-dehydrorhamnose reductase
MSRTIVVTGGSGLLGLNWAAARRDLDRVVLWMHRRKTALAGVEAFFVDSDTDAAVDRMLGQAEADLVIHTAGLTDVDACEAQPDRAYAANVILAARIARSAHRHGCDLVHVSTDHLFGNEADFITEAAEPAPTNVYGQTKAEAEKRVLDAHPRAIVVRTNFYCWGPPYRTSFSDVIIDSLRTGKTIRLFDDVCYTPIIATALVAAVHELLNARAAGIFNVSGDDALTKHDFGCRVARRFGLDATLIERGSVADLPLLAPRPRNMRLSNRKLTDAIGRRVGGVDAHLDELFGQEIMGWPQELRQE